MTCKREDCEQPVREYVGRGQPPKYCSVKCRSTKTPERARRHKLASRYGISVSEYDQMLAEQGGACAICGTSGPDAARWGLLVVDHDHETGEVRGLLCSNCNCAIGLLGDRPETVRKAAAYLSRRTPSKEGLK